jgi:hypothetical protein
VRRAAARHSSAALAPTSPRIASAGALSG